MSAMAQDATRLPAAQRVHDGSRLAGRRGSSRATHVARKVRSPEEENDAEDGHRRDRVTPCAVRPAELIGGACRPWRRMLLGYPQPSKSQMGHGERDGAEHARPADSGIFED